MKSHPFACAAILLCIASQAWAGKVKISFFGPERCGLSGIQTVAMDTDVKPPPIRLDDAMALPDPSERTFDARTTFVQPWVCAHGNQQSRPLSPAENQQLKERMSVLATVRLTYDSFARHMYTLTYHGLVPGTASLKNFALTITPHDDQCGDKNAFYGRTGRVGGKGVLSFCSGSTPMVRLFDIGSHETSHGVFDALAPKYYGADSPTHPYGALHESFADLGAIFTSCDVAVLTGQEGAVGAFLTERDEAGFCMTPGWDGAGTCLRSRHTYEIGADVCEEHNNSILLTDLFVGAMRGTYQDVMAEWSPLRDPRMTVQYFQKALIGTVAHSPDFRSLREFATYVQDTQDRMAGTIVASADDFSFVTRATSEDEQMLFYDAAGDNFTALLEGELGDRMNHCMA